MPENAKCTRQSRDRLTNSILILTAVAIIYAIVIATSIRRYGDNLTGLIHVGQNAAWEPPAQLGHHIVVFRNSVGYDGEAYYIVADDPFLQRHEFRDAFRYQRIGYPFVIWAASFGRREWRPTVMVGVNVVAVLIVAYVSILLTSAIGTNISDWWALACAVNPSLLLAVRLDLAEPLTMALSLSGLLFYLKRRIGWATLVLGAAILTREVAFLFVLPLFVAEICLHRFRHAFVLALTAIPYLLWQSVLWQICGHVGVEGSKGNFDTPLTGIRIITTSAWHTPWRVVLGQQAATLCIATLVGVAFVVFAMDLRKRPDILVGIGLVHAGAALLAGPAIWVGYEGAARVFGGLYPTIIFAFTRRHTPARATLVFGTMLMIALTIGGGLASPSRPYYLTP